MVRRDDVKPPVTPRRIVAGVLIGVGLLLPLLVMTYAKDAPRLGGWPFFYWYQMLLVFVTAGLTAVAYLLMRLDDKQRRRRTEQRSDTRDDDGAAK